MPRSLTNVVLPNNAFRPAHEKAVRRLCLGVDPPLCEHGYINSTIYYSDEPEKIILTDEIDNHRPFYSDCLDSLTASYWRL